MSDYFDTTIGEQLTLQRGFDITKKQQKPGDVPVVSSGGISSYHNEAKVKGPGVVLGRKGSLGTVFYIEGDFWPHDTSLWVKDFKGNSPRFVYYYFKSIADKLKKMDVGAANPALNRNHVHPMEVVWPIRSRQDDIVEVLSKLDDKIELNRQTNQTLEQIAQAIFKSWFVDFDPVKSKIEAKQAGATPEQIERAAMGAISGKSLEELDQLSPDTQQQLKTTAALFPDTLVDSELGTIPEGWSVVEMKKLALKISKGTTPRKADMQKAEDAEEIPFLKVRDMSDDGEISREGLDKIPESIHIGALKRSILEKDDLLFSIAGTIGRVACLEEDLSNSNCNQAIAFIRLSNPEKYLELCRHNLVGKRVQDEVVSKVVQGVQANFSLTGLGEIKILDPENEILNLFNVYAQNIRKNQNLLLAKNRNLAELRDALLPKLLSGEHGLSDVA